MKRLQGLPGLTLLDSALPMERMGRYSYLGVDPIEIFRLNRSQIGLMEPSGTLVSAVDSVVSDPIAQPEASAYSSELGARPSPKAAFHLDPLAPISKSLEQNKDFQTHQNLPPFQGGWMGFFGYEFGRCFERVPSAKHDEFDLPIAMFGLYDIVLAWDHQAPGRGWIFSSGLPEYDSGRRETRQVQRRDLFMEILERPTLDDPSHANMASAYGRFQATGFQAMAHGLTAPQFETRLGGGWLGSFDSLGFRKAVDQAREYIYAGDIFQVNLAQRLMKPSSVDSATLYRHLREVNAAPFAGYFDGGSFQIISASPERFLQVRDRIVETRPIKGTRRRTGSSVDDGELARELTDSPKDRAENTMIVDLLRNDLSRVCEPNSISVPQWCDVEFYPYIIHLVSAVQGKLCESASITDLIRATFPGGSITGAPKIRAMEIISELEPTVRGPYCGSLGYIGLDGSLDMNILIRTITASRGWWQMQVGGGIVADSHSDMEEEETWTKAAGLVKAIASCTTRNF